MKKTIENFNPVIEALSEENRKLISDFFVGEKAFDDFIKKKQLVIW